MKELQIPTTNSYGIAYTITQRWAETKEERQELCQMIAKELDHRYIFRRKKLSAWHRGIKQYALEILEEISDNYGENAVRSVSDLLALALNGADNWHHYSWSGCTYCYDSDIAEILCTPSQLKKNHNGSYRPNCREEWLDVQARALELAWRAIRTSALAIGLPKERLD